MTQFYLKDKSIDLDLGYGSYHIFFNGSWYIKNLEELDIELINLETKKKINLKAKDFVGLRKQDYIGGEKAVQAFEFDLLKASKLKISIKNPEVLIMKKVHPFMFMYSMLFPRKIEIDKIKVAIK